MSPPNADLKPFSLGPSVFGNMGRTVIVKGTAYKTCARFSCGFQYLVTSSTYCLRWVALVAYLYTGQITFATLRSTSRSSKDAKLCRHRLEDHLVQSCSPKSMYRLADKVDNIPLMHIILLAQPSSAVWSSKAERAGVGQDSYRTKSRQHRAGAHIIFHFLVRVR